MRRRIIGLAGLAGAALSVAGILAAAQAAAAAEPVSVAVPVAQRSFQECPDCSKMVAVPGGDFVMGSPSHEWGRFQNEGPQHVVHVPAFAMAETPVTSEQFLKFLRETGYEPKPCNGLIGMGWKPQAGDQPYAPFNVLPRRWPAMCLDWKDAHAYIDWVNAKLKAARPNVKHLYRLPSEAEWEYAARAGTRTARWWGEEIGTGHANCNGCGSRWDGKELAEVASFPPNAFGLYDMLGNVWQWTEDCWHASFKLKDGRTAPADGSAWMEKSCAKHVLRGGSWNNLPLFVRAAARSGGSPDGGEYDYSSLAGFRLARSLP